MSGEKNSFPVALTIAGSDSGGGAGIQADLRAFRAAGVFGCSVIAAITAQNPARVLRIDPLPPESLQAQIEAVASVFHVGAVKTGMLFSAELIRTVVAELKRFTCPVVVDPVMVSTSGVPLLRQDAVQAVCGELLPAADWITPNIPEAELLLDRKLNSFDELLEGAKELASRFHCGVVLKGGHAEDDPEARDAVFFGGRGMILLSPRIRTLPHAAHGTGCTFSSSLAAGLARGLSPESALTYAKRFVFESLAGAALVSKPGVPPVAAMPPDFRCGADESDKIRLVSI
ncbi:MAG: bifunctional hydroxymethylpyrimidine kinase/phosphomethylpyrimidine kinase [Lentisphaeria bacterium]|nr:bifunctional hydroxymethylpyrimidine kinase/phosphomethylpyrimidine kinase [Lentisphaeria bacterium]